jgi:hypothetical protein
MCEVFISKSTKDDLVAEAVCNVLEKNHIKCWIAPRNILGGKDYAEEISKGIKEAQILLVIVSKNSNESKHVLNEINLAVEFNKIILPFKIDEAEINESFRYYLDRTHAIHAFPETSTFFSTLVKNVTVLLDKKINEETIISLADDEYKKKMNYDILRKETQEKRFAFAKSLEVSTNVEKDIYHHYDEIVRLDVVDSISSRYSSYRFITLTNVSDSITNFIIHKESGENKTDFVKMRVRAKLYDVRGESLTVESITKIQPNFEQYFKIYFPKPLRPNESITIFYRLDWPNEPDAYFKAELTQSISLTRYLCGVSRLTFGVFEPYKFGAASMDAVDSFFKVHPSNAYPKYMSIREEDRLMPLHDQTMYGVEFTVDEVKEIAYRVNYKLSNITIDEDEDFF